MMFVDTNYFLRFLLAEENEQSRATRALFDDGASGRARLSTSSIVFFELYWVLTSFYKKEKSEVVAVLEGVLAMDFVFIPEREMLERALAIFRATGLSLEDAYNVAFAQAYSLSDFRTFDKALAKYVRTGGKHT